MTTKIIELTEKIYNEGIEKANKEAAVILSEARESAKKIEVEAKLKSEKIVADAKKESDTIFDSLHAELKSIATETLAVAKQRIADCIVAEYANEIVNTLLDDKKFVKSLLLETVKKWDIEKGSLPDLSLVVPEKQLKEFEEIIKSDIVAILQNTPILKIDPSMKNGFRIVSSTSGYQVSFSDSDMANFFKAFMKPRISKFLFDNSQDD